MSTSFAPDAPTAEQATTVLGDTNAGPAAAAPRGPQPDPAGRTHTFTIASFILGIVSVVSGWTFIAPIVGLTLGVIALRRGTKDRALALWGVWLNAAMLAISAIVVLFSVLFVGMGLLAVPFMDLGSEFSSAMIG
ncbi:DUF4190 domain-containing protein [Leucobacter sp. CSA2]|uniref:DUF4190 domain-containing protein n=1 Tax=Leucobacter edaphi TaxID=2796472 RepID=A0A934QDS8_9MICO|nr:DUF4190 domain-containing protein [Leucobacter edaphi]MBK0422786.1 DUF4190 domain-containing protein [Leucobacter edaphi]